MTDYVYKCNLELLKTEVGKRKDKLRNITKRIVKEPQTYRNMEETFRYWAKQLDVSVYELEDPKLMYPDELEW